jgi:GH15 family glucan-1,4-alpha-glucosidase
MARFSPEPPAEIAAVLPVLIGSARGGPELVANAESARRQSQAPIRDYGVIGDGRTAALVASDGSIDWLCLPNLDSASVFGGLLDQQRGGSFRLAPKVEFQSRRRYLPETNVLETTYDTDRGRVRVTDAMTLPRAGLAPQRELVRRVEPIDGEVPMSWRVEPRFGYGSQPARIGMRAGVAVASAGADALAVRAWNAGTTVCDTEAISGEFVSSAGLPALLVLSASHAEPLVFPGRDEAEARLDATVDFWRSWASTRSYDGPWRAAVIRSALALKLLVYAPSGAIAAAATTSLPEVLGGVRNWDYRYSWPRDAAFTLDAFLSLGCSPEADAYFSWLLHASQLTHPGLRVLYRLDGGARAPERELSLAGYRGSRPVRVGNAAAPQLQLDVYGELLQTAHRYTATGRRLDRETSRRLGEIADEVCQLWHRPDAGIWEVRDEPAHYTQSKVMCWVALDCASELADDGQLPDAHADRWEATADEIREFIDSHCWSPERHSYLRAPDIQGLDASLLFTALMGFRPADQTRVDATIDAVREELSHGPLLYRYRGADGLPGREGCFVACSFWLVETLARRGRRQEASALMEELLPLANDLGLYSEEIDPDTGGFLGNFPQALAHLALINAATTLAEGSEP